MAKEAASKKASPEKKPFARGRKRPGGFWKETPSKDRREGEVSQEGKAVSLHDRKIAGKFLHHRAAQDGFPETIDRKYPHERQNEKTKGYCMSTKKG